MTFDAKSLLTEPLPPDLTVDGLVAALAKIQAVGMGGAGVKLPGGAPVRKISLVAHGEQAAHFVLAAGCKDESSSAIPMHDIIQALLDEFVGPDLTGWDEGSVVKRAVDALRTHHQHQ